jgi:hypothetical protein
LNHLPIIFGYAVKTRCSTKYGDCKFIFLVPSFLATKNLQNHFFFQIFNFRFLAKFRQLKGKKAGVAATIAKGLGFRFKFYSQLAKTTVYIFFGIKSARALAKLTRRSQVRNSNLFIIYLFICLFIIY